MRSNIVIITLIDRQKSILLNEVAILISDKSILCPYSNDPIRIKMTIKAMKIAYKVRALNCRR